jgi:signal transduction histidine kinase/ligand-binding sensor domain-containing protein
MRWVFVSFFSCLLCVYTNAQSALFTFTNYSTANGLADNSVTKILQDSRGFMWFGTKEGLSRFDGTNFKNFFARKNDSTAMPGNSVVHLFEYAPGQLLMTSSGSVVTMNTITHQFHQLEQFQNKSVNYMSRLQNNLYAINRIDTCFIINEQLLIVDTLLPPFKIKGTVATITRINEKNWLVGTPWEYFFYNTDDKNYKPFIAQKDMPARQKTLAIQYYDEKTKWLYFSNYYDGLFRYSLEGKLMHNWKIEDKPSGLHDGNISFVILKNDSTLWIGSYEGEGLNILNTHSNLFTRIKTSSDNNSSLASNSIAFNYTDRDKNEWIATTNGVSKLNNSTASIKGWKTEFPELSDNNIMLNLAKGSDGQMYVSVFGTRYCYKINNSNDKVLLLDKSKLPIIWCMNTFGNELIFTGGTRITTFNPLTKQYWQNDFLHMYFPVSDIIILAFKHSNGDKWYSGNNGGGFVREDAKDGSIHQYKKDGPRGTFQISYYTYYAEDKNGDLWFGVNKSSRLLHWDKKSDYFNEVSFDTVKGISASSLAGISDITLDKDKNIWIAFDGAGVAKYDPSTNTAVQYTIQDGLPTNYVYALKFDNKNRLWIGTLKGLSCLLVDENRFTNFTKEEGLPADYFGERCIYYDSSSHQLWAGSRNTLMRFDPDVILSNTRKQFPIYIDEIIVNGQYYKGDDFTTISFLPSQNNLQFRFIGLDINSGRDIEYSYQLTSADKDWIYNGNIQTASYTNLAPGHYIFVVRARHKGEIDWKVMQQPLHFSIATPWNKTWWFRLLLLFVVAAISIQLIKTHFQRKLQKQRITIEKELAIEQERTRLARELHDGLGSMLSGIKHSFSAIKNTLDLNEKQEINFDETIDKLNETVREIRTISHSMASGTLLQSGLEDSLRDYCRFLNSPGGLKISFEALLMEKKKLNEDQAFHIFRIVQELLQNIIKHSAASQAIVQLSYNANRLFITVEDDGKGFEMKDALSKNGLGLKNIQSRIKIVNGKMDVRTAAGKGTSVLIEIPCD